MPTATLTCPPSTYARQHHKKRSVHLNQDQDDDGSQSSPPSRPLRRGNRRKATHLRTAEKARKAPPPLMQKVGLAAQVYSIQSLMGTVEWFQGWREWLYPPSQHVAPPNIVKAYEQRPTMPVRIFFPASYDLTSPQTLPTVLSIHGGGFCLGTAKDDDEWNRRFADSQHMLVVSLPYQKAPRAVFPAGLQDLEALYLAVLADESLPIDRTSPRTHNQPSKNKNNNNNNSHPPACGRIALAGFDAGGNLALALSQLAGIRRCAVPPAAVVSICGYLDLSQAAPAKTRNRPYKPALSRPRNHVEGVDPLGATYPAYVWSYVPYGQDLRDPLLSPAFASWEGVGGYQGDDEEDDNDEGEACEAVVTTNGQWRGGLPPHVCLVGAELDMLAHESWRLACRLVRDGGMARGDGRTGRWRVPDPDAEDALQRLCGRGEPSPNKGRLEVLEDDVKALAATPEDGLDVSKKFGFEVRWKAEAEEEEGGRESGSVKWILVPDAMHGFDRGWWVPAGGGTAEMEETVRDAALKTVAYVDAVGGWLRGTVWESGATSR